MGTGAAWLGGQDASQASSGDAEPDGVSSDACACTVHVPATPSWPDEQRVARQAPSGPGALTMSWIRATVRSGMMSGALSSRSVTMLRPASLAAYWNISATA